MLDGIQPRKHEESVPPPETKTKRRRLWPYVFILIFIAAAVLVSARVVALAGKILDKSENPFASIGKLFLGQDKPLAGEETGEIRILLLGIGGEGHEGPLLTDTMLLATIRLPRDSGQGIKIGLVSIPRDLNVLTDAQEYRKINSAYAYEGGEGARRAAGRIFGETIPYYAVIDFQGFEQAIDDLGGISINVETGFTDRQYPDENLGFLPPITFEEGAQKMDGQRALQYVRSRHGDNGQGSDFARSKRQQQVLAAIWDKSNDFRVVANPGLLNRVLSRLANNFRTNLEPHEIKRLYSMTKELKKENILSLSIDEASGLVCSQLVPETGAYVLLPCQGLENYDAIRELVRNLFLTGGMVAEQPLIEIQNATAIPALGKSVQDYLALSGVRFQIGNFRGAAVYNETVLYDNTKGAKPASLNYLKEKLGSRVAGGIFPFPTQNKNPDFVIVVAADIQSKLPAN